ncbi:hypothetical protein RAC89_23080 [Paenibacillus sp. GD4]|uniref:hypothetical protein n=1 Tax=Paenibacillus sp. GD4 TaxID=3068890 RepID=UPI0027966E60|nr:hypothetical protein [Paenibacillus sp. GD4]MDQ1913284.1 hypothetical protein [Paenibacillus sp. GD4]
MKYRDVTDRFINSHEDIATDEIWTMVREIVAQMIRNKRVVRDGEKRWKTSNVWNTTEDFDRALLQWETTTGERAAKAEESPELN